VEKGKITLIGATTEFLFVYSSSNCDYVEY